MHIVPFHLAYCFPLATLCADSACPILLSLAHKPWAVMPSLIVFFIWVTLTCHLPEYGFLDSCLPSPHHLLSATFHVIPEAHVTLYSGGVPVRLPHWTVCPLTNPHGAPFRSSCLVNCNLLGLRKLKSLLVKEGVTLRRRFVRGLR